MDLGLILHFYYNILPLINLLLFIAFAVCLILLVIKLIRHKKGIKTLLIVLVSIFILANVISWGLSFAVSRDRIYQDKNKYIDAHGEEFLLSYIPDDATEITYWTKNPRTGFGSYCSGVSYKVNSNNLYDQIDSIIRTNYGAKYSEELLTNAEDSYFGMTYDQWLKEPYNEWSKALNKKLIGNDNLSDYRALYCNNSDGYDVYVFVNEKTCRFVFLSIYHH